MSCFFVESPAFSEKMSCFYNNPSGNPNLGTKWWWVVHFTPRPLYPRCPFRIIQIWIALSALSSERAWLTVYPLPRQSTLYSVIRSGGGGWGLWCGDWRCWMSLWRSEGTFWGCTKFWDRPDFPSAIIRRCIQERWPVNVTDWQQMTACSQKNSCKCLTMHVQ
jgi:hypothetical protein